MFTLSRVALILSALPLVLKLVIDGQLSIHQAGLVLVGGCVLAAVGNGMIRLVFAGVSLLGFVWEITGGDLVAVNTLALSLLQALTKNGTSDRKCSVSPWR